MLVGGFSLIAPFANHSACRTFVRKYLVCTQIELGPIDIRHLVETVVYAT